MKKNEELIREAISYHLKHYRRHKYKTQQQMATKLSIKQRRYAKYEEKIATPPVFILLRMAEILGISVNELTTRVKEMA